MSNFQPPEQKLPAYLTPAEPVYGPPASPGSPERSGLALAALITGIVAFVISGAPFIGGLAAVAGIILGIVALRAHQSTVKSVVGLSLAGLGLLGNLLATGLLILVLANADGIDGLSKSVDDAVSQELAPTSVSTTNLETPCYSFDVPTGYINNQSKEATAACVTTDQLWGEYRADGTVNNTGVGTILGSVLVEPVSHEKSSVVNPGDTLRGMVSYLNAEFVPAMGTVIGEPEMITVDGQPATLIRVRSTVAETKTKALLVLRAPASYPQTGEDARYFMLSFVTPEDNGDAIIDAAVTSWTWK